MGFPTLPPSNYGEPIGRQKPAGNLATFGLPRIVPVELWETHRSPEILRKSGDRWASQKGRRRIY
eukprot:7139547-Pyramimonas_sp.AAC.1